MVIALVAHKNQLHLAIVDSNGKLFAWGIIDHNMTVCQNGNELRLAKKFTKWVWVHRNYQGKMPLLLSTIKNVVKC